jgi:hypothetical protein
LIEEQISDAISGHGSESEGRQYGVYKLRLMAAEIAKLPNPLAEAPGAEAAPMRKATPPLADGNPQVKSLIPRAHGSPR